MITQYPDALALISGFAAHDRSLVTRIPKKNPLAPRVTLYDTYSQDISDATHLCPEMQAVAKMADLTKSCQLT